MTTAEIAPYSFSSGGPLRALEQWLCLPRNDGRDWLRRALLTALVAYVPMVVFGALWRLSSGEWPDLVARWATHARWLVAAPLLFLAEQMVDVRARLATRYLRDSELLPASEYDVYRRTLQSSEQLRDSWVAEAVLLALATGSAFAAIWGVGVVGAALPHWWNGTIALSLFRFLLLRWLWRWLIWGLLLYRLSALRLRLTVLHPDRLGGLEPLLGPSYAFAAAVAAVAAASAAGFADLMIRNGLAADAFYQPVVAYVAVAYVLAAAPLCPFGGPLYDLRKRGLHEYGALATRYCAAFERRWFGRPGEQVLGSPDVQSLADLGTSFEVASGIQLLPASRRLVVVVLVAALTPMLPLALHEVAFSKLLLALLKVVV